MQHEPGLPGVHRARGRQLPVKCAHADPDRVAARQAARLSGNGEFRILLVHILPNIMPIMIVQMSLTMGYAILNAAGLSFIGLGVRPPTAEWGIMVADGSAFMISGEWWVATFPGAALMITERLNALESPIRGLRIGRRGSTPWGCWPMR